MTTYCLYWTQYSCNFFIYAARNDQYRKAYYVFLDAMWKKMFFFSRKHKNDSAILFVDKSLLPKKLLEFYERVPDDIKSKKGYSKYKKSVRFDITETHHDEKQVDSMNRKLTSSISESCKKFRVRFSQNDHTLFSRVELKIHLPTKNKQQCPIVIANSIRQRPSRNTERRNSDTKIDSYIEVGKQTIDINMDNMISNNRKHTIPERNLENFSTRIEMKSIVGNGTYRESVRTNKDRKKDMESVVTLTNYEKNISVVLGINSSNGSFYSSKNLIRQNSF